MLANLRALFVVVIDMIRFKGGPENLPTSTTLLACVVAAFAAATAMAAAKVATPEQQGWPAENLAATQTTPLPLALATVVLTLWLLAIEVRIIRTAFEWPTGGALGMVLAQEFSAALFFGILLGLTTNPG